MNIGSGKLSKDEMRNVPHYLIDLLNPDVFVDAGVFCNYAEDYCSQIQDKGKIPFFVGGTGLYIDSFFNGLSKIPEISPDVRGNLEKEANVKGLDFLFDKLQKSDPEAALKIHTNDKQRIIRALQVYEGTGKPFSYYKNNKQGRDSEKTLYIGLEIERKELYEKINLRVDHMIDSGFVEEVQNLLDMGFNAQLKSMNSIGYSEIFSYLSGDCSLDEAIRKMKYETRRYAKRQLTWFKRNIKINWFHPYEYENVVDLIDGWIKK